MDSNNVVYYNFKNRANGTALENSSPPASGVRAFITSTKNGKKVITNLSGLSEVDLVWALINSASTALKNRQKIMDEKVDLVKSYITN